MLEINVRELLSSKLKGVTRKHQMFEIKEVNKLYDFLDAQQITEKWENEVKKNYDDLEDLEIAVICTFGNMKEMVSCFITYKNTADGVDYWKNINELWQEHLMLTSIEVN